MAKDRPGDPGNPILLDRLLSANHGRVAGPGRCEIRVRENLERRWSEWFEDLELIGDESEGTTLSGMLPDQAALHGLLAAFPAISHQRPAISHQHSAPSTRLSPQSPVLSPRW